MDLALKVLEKRALRRLRNDKRSTNSDNPYLERVPVFKNGKIIKYETDKRKIPKHLSPNDAKILKRVRKRAYRWDMGFSCCCCGLKFGWSAIIGFLPVIGDFADFFMALLLIKTAAKVDGGLPKRLYAMMFTNILIDLAAGFIPFFGDIIDMFYRANTRNAWLLDAYLTEKAEAIGKRAIKDPEDGSKLAVPPELKGAPGDRDVEQGLEPVRMVEGPRPVAPAFVTPARTQTPMENMAPPPKSGMPGRNLTGRQVQDPRDRAGKKR